MRVLVIAPSFRAWDLGRFVVQSLESRGLETLSLATQPFQSARQARRSLLEAYRLHEPDRVFGTALARLQPALRELVERERPDRIVLLALSRVSPSTLRALKTPVLAWYVDCFQEGCPVWMRERLPFLRAFFCTSRALAREVGGHWLVEGARLECFPEPDGPVPALYGSQVAFVGSIYHPAPDEETARFRERLLKRIGREFELKVWGAQGDPMTRRRWGQASDYPVREWPTFNEELVKVCRASAIVLGTNLFNQVEGYFSNRTFLTLAAGGFHLTHYVPGLEELFDNHRHLVWYRDADECLELIGHYLPRAAEREAIARAGRLHVRERFSNDWQVEQLVRAF